MEYFIGVDVGTHSARAGLFTSQGELVAMHKKGIQMNNPQADYYEQSSEDIWAAICTCVRQVGAEAAAAIPGFSKDQVRGVGMDATCSLVALDTSTAEPMSVSTAGDKKWNIIVWCDHRAAKEAELINRSGREVLKYVGGKVSIEMELPKIAWLKGFLKQAGRMDEWRRMEFFDLPDFLSYRATGIKARSNCSLACKWLFTPSQPSGQQAADGAGWDEQVFAAADLDDIVETRFKQIGGCLSDGTLTVLQAGEPIGRGLSAAAAAELGLAEGTPVGASVIDAYAGWFGTIASGSPGASVDRNDPNCAGQRLAIIAGTSACHLLATKHPVLVPGVWGPYYNVSLSGWYMLEGGQSAVGSLIDYVVKSHSAYAKLSQQSSESGKSVYTLLDEVLLDMAAPEAASKGSDPASQLVALVKSLHFLPDHHGNRAPLADPHMRGSIVGETLTAADSIEALAARYLACICGLAYGTRAILDAVVAAGGRRVTELLMSGGLSQGRVFTQILADVTGAQVIVPRFVDGAVVLGSAILGRVASEYSSSGDADPSGEAHTRRLWESMASMSGEGSVVQPTTDAATLALHERKYRVMLEMQQDQLKYRAMME
ncbi:Pentulose kinase [Martensiomyces pterosporus]|nr:Pentulose kinase [Martensiomyces pterosporus]